MPSARTILDFTLAEPVKKRVVKKAVPEEKVQLKRGGKKSTDPSITQPVPPKRGRKPLKDADADADLIHVPGDDILFQKQYYSMGELVEMFRINASLIRFWENQFDILQPKKNKKGDRFFRPEDVKNLHLIFHLLRQRKYTLEGAKAYLKNERSGADKKFEMTQSLQKIRNFLLEIRAAL